MKRFCKFTIHEYMDMHPSYITRLFEGKEESEIKATAVEWASEMTKIYSGGPTTFIKILNREEAAEFLTKEFKACLMDTCWPDEDNIEEALKVTSENNIKLFFECYGRNSNK